MPSSSSSCHKSKNPTIVVVGGGPAGVSVFHVIRKEIQKHLKKKKRRDKTNINHLHLILIDPRQYWEAPWASIRGMFDKYTRENMLVNFQDFIKNDDDEHIKIQIICGKAIELNPNQVIVELTHNNNNDNNSSNDDEGCDEEENTKIIGFDYCVLATGSSYCGSIGVFKGVVEKKNGMEKRQVRLKSLKEMGENISKAQDILIVGGGAVGVEIAAEILDWIPEKKVVVVNKGKRLLDGFDSEKASRICKEKLEKLNCVIHLNEEVKEQDDGSFKSAYSGHVYKADLVFKCLGISSNSNYMMSKMRDKVDEKGFIKVNEYFQVCGTESIFALGDCSNAHKRKLCAEIGFQFKTVARNVVETLKASEMKRTPHLSAYRPGPKIVCTVLGRSAGVAITPIGATTWILPRVKNRDLFVNLQKSRSGIPTD